MAGCRACKCNDGMQNTGAGCSTIMQDMRGGAFQPLYANDGTRNGINMATAVINEAFFTGVINETDESKRWFIIPQSDGLKNVEEPVADPTYETFTDDSKMFIKDGIKGFKGWITGNIASPKLKGKIESARCLSAAGGVGVWKFDREGNLIGIYDATANYLYPMPLDTESIAVKFIRATPKESAKLELAFDFSQNLKDEDLAMISCDEMDGVDILMLRGLLDICVEVTNITEDGFTAKLINEFGTITNPGTDKGLVAGDFTITNVTDNDSNIGFTGSGGDFEENPDGTYIFTFDTADQPAIGDILKLTPVKNGRDYSCVTDTEILVPNT